MNKNGLLTKFFSWGTSASFSDTTINVWLYGLALVLILAFLWSTVIRALIRETVTAV